MVFVCLGSFFVRIFLYVGKFFSCGEFSACRSIKLCTCHFFCGSLKLFFLWEFKIMHVSFFVWLCGEAVRKFCWLGNDLGYL